MTNREQNVWTAQKSLQIILIVTLYTLNLSELPFHFLHISWWHVRNVHFFSETLYWSCRFSRHRALVWYPSSSTNIICGGRCQYLKCWWKKKHKRVATNPNILCRNWRRNKLSRLQLRDHHCYLEIERRKSRLGAFKTMKYSNRFQGTFTFVTYFHFHSSANQASSKHIPLNYYD